MAPVALFIGAGCVHHDMVATEPPHPLECESIAHQIEGAPLVDPAAVVEVRELHEYHGKQHLRRTTGAALTILARPGESEAWLERVGRCKAAEARFRSVDALPIAGAEVHVRRHGPYFEIRLTSKSARHGRDIWHQTSSLYKTPS